MFHLSHFRRLVVVVFVAACGLGCSNDPYRNFVTVSGTVVCEGEPAAGGTITFTPLDAASQTGRIKGEPGRPSTGMVKEDGTFELRAKKIGQNGEERGALVGPHTVTFEGPLTERKVVSGMQLRLPSEAQKLLQAEFDAAPVFPALACGTTITPSTVEVKTAASDNRFEFTLSGAPAKPPGKAAEDSAKSAPPVARKGGKKSGSGLFNAPKVKGLEAN
ncbi:MAG: hypothetical protein ACT4QC_24060 [Planctomycetaceae bacterium]